YGLFFNDEDVLEQFIIFSRHTNFFTKQHLSLASLDGRFGLYTVNPNGDYVELPLRRTPYQSPVNGKGPFTLFGLKFTEKNEPLVLVNETDDLNRYNIIYEEDGILKTGFYKQQEADDILEEIYEDYEGPRTISELSSREGVFPEEITDESIDDLFTDIYGPKALPRGPSVTIEGERPKITKEETDIDWMKPATIVEYLDRFVVGQDVAKKAMAVAFSNYMAKAQIQDNGMQVDNQLLYGPSGVGKTLIIETLAKAAQLRVGRCSLTGKSGAGFVGASLSDVFQIFENEKGGAPYGLIFLDEIDKLAQASTSNNDWGDNLQDELIGILENGEVYLPDKQNKQIMRRISTENLLFFVAGAFNGFAGNNSLEALVERRLGNDKNVMGFGSSFVTENNDWQQKVIEEDFINYGLKPELLGRITNYTSLTSLTEEQLIRILHEPDNSLFDRYGRVCEAKGYHLNVTKEALRMIAETGKSTLGARSLRAVCSKLFTEALYDPEALAKDGKLIIDGAFVQQILNTLEADDVPLLAPPK
ncbi:AAA domain-containing protein, partial [Candidatus Woesearchaeota archaeon]|nr:AAA domain-containing protein [Candidatus Woesearchaeota archaeon]